jgi:acyl-CoA-binding protein
VTQVGQIGSEFLRILSDRLLLPANFALFQSAKTADQTQKAGFPHAVVTFKVEPLAGLEGKRNA